MPKLRPINKKLRNLRIAMRVMLLMGLCAMAYVILQSCSLPKQDLQRFAKGSFEKLQVLNAPPAQPSRKFVDINGSSVSLKDFHGDFVFLNVWATWCVPCIAEIPSLDALQGEYQAKGLTVIAVSMDRHRVEAESFYKTIDVKYLGLYHDPNLGMAADVGVQGLPISIFYDPQGREIARIPGDVDWQSGEVRDFLEYLLP